MDKALKPILVLGLGNDILSDDAIGLFVTRQLREAFGPHDQIECVECFEMGLGLLDFIVGRQVLIVVDSVQTGKHPPGYLHEIGEKELPTLPGMSPHFLGVGEILVLGRKLEYPMPAKVVIFAVEVADPFTVSTRLTPALETLLPAITRQIRNTVESFLYCLNQK